MRIRAPGLWARVGRAWLRFGAGGRAPGLCVPALAGALGFGSFAPRGWKCDFEAAFVGNRGRQLRPLPELACQSRYVICSWPLINEAFHFSDRCNRNR